MYLCIIYFAPVSCSVQSCWGSSGISSTCMLFLLQSLFYHRSAVCWASSWRRTETLYANGLQTSIKLADHLRPLLIMLILPITSCQSLPIAVSLSLAVQKCVMFLVKCLSKLRFVLMAICQMDKTEHSFGLPNS